MKSFVITIHRTPERLKEFQRCWNAPFDCEVYYGLDHGDVVLPVGWTHEPGYCALNLGTADLLCRMIHAREPFAVFQDDALFWPGWHEYATHAVEEIEEASGHDWLFINLGAQASDPRYKNPVLVSPHLARMHYGWRTHAVVYNPSRIPDVLYQLFSRRIPDDQIWCDLMIAGWASFFMTRLFLVGVRPTTSVCTGRPDSFAEDALGRPAHPCLA